MRYGTDQWLRASVTALGLGVWAAACTSASQDPAGDGAAAASGPATGSVGSGGASSGDSVTGGTPTTTTDATTTTTGQATAAATSVGGATGTGVVSTSDGSGTTTTATAVGGTSGTGTGGAGTMGAVATTGGGTTGVGGEAACTDPPALAVPVVADFEGYDGATVALDWSFEFNDDGSGMNVLYGGFFDASDMSGTPSLDMVGSDASLWAVRATNTEASEWGGGIGIWLGCMDASSYTGLSLAIRGSTPNSNAVDVAISVDGLSGGVRKTVTVTDLFTTFQIPFSDFTNEYDETTNGSNINGLSVNAIMLWEQDLDTEEWFPIPGGYELVVDDIGFY